MCMSLLVYLVYVSYISDICCAVCKGYTVSHVYYDVIYIARFV